MNDCFGETVSLVWTAMMGAGPQQAARCVKGYLLWWETIAAPEWAMDDGQGVGRE